MYIQVNIGRNFEPDRYNRFAGTLSELQWNEFQNDIVYALESFREHTDMDHQVPEIHLGTGVWNNKVEESAKISLYHEGGFDTDGLKNHIYGLKKHYSQESIAIIIGSQLI